MQLEVLTPDKNLFSGEVEAVNLPGTKGAFEILNNHAPIISSLNEGTLTYKTGEGQKAINIKSGFVECLNNRVVVLVEGGESV
ncbi:MAG: ATP synthase F1 subunit epsilon [Chitinophagales bacterium]|nr:ATP synthase F1 subunit epsilon [Chitinophagales bacterium]